MQNDYFHEEPPPSSNATNTDSHPSVDENISSSKPPSHIDVEKVEVKEHDAADDDDDDDDEKHIQTELANDNKPLIQVFVPDDSSTYSFYEDFPYRDSQQQHANQQTHTNSHDSLLQADYHPLDTMNTANSSTDDLSTTTTHQLSASVFHSKDSALGLSDDNLNLPSTNPFLIKDDDEEENDHDEDDDDDHPKHILLTSSSLQPVHDNQSKYRLISGLFLLQMQTRQFN